MATTITCPSGAKGSDSLAESKKNGRSQLTRKRRKRTFFAPETAFLEDRKMWDRKIEFRAFY
jgi:hypothetical protein